MRAILEKKKKTMKNRPREINIPYYEREVDFEHLLLFFLIYFFFKKYILLGPEGLHSPSWFGKEEIDIEHELGDTE